jgi:hypothetical protein
MSNDSINIEISETPVCVSLADENITIEINGQGITLATVKADTDIADAISKKHTQNSDTKLASGTANEVTATNAKSAVDLKHIQGTDQGLDAGGSNQILASEIIQNNKYLNNLLSTGLLTGGILSINADDDTKFDISAGAGIVVNNYTDPSNPTRTFVTWEDKIGVVDPYLTSISTTYINIDKDGELIFLTDVPSDENRRDYILLGWTDHTDLTTIGDIISEPIYNCDIQAQLNDFFENFGAFNISGNIYNFLTGLTIQRSTGKTFDGNANYSISKKNPHIVSTDLEAPANLYYYYRDGVDDWINDNPVTTTIDPNNYDDNSGTLAVVPSDKWTIQVISFYSPTVVNDIQYGQRIYDSSADAESDIDNIIEINPYNNYDTFRCWIIVKQGATDLSDTNQAIFRAAGKLGMIDISSSGGPGGEINTASNQGLDGIGLYLNKMGVDLQFKNINAASNKITVTNNASRKTVDIDIDTENLPSSVLPNDSSVSGDTIKDALDTLSLLKATFNAQVGTTYTLALSDIAKIITLSNASPITVSIPTNAVVAFSIGTRIDFIQGAAGKVTFGGSGVTIKSKNSNKSISAQYVAVSLIKESTDTWYLIGDLV